MANIKQPKREKNGRPKHTTFKSSKVKRRQDEKDALKNATERMVASGTWNDFPSTI